MRDSARMGGLNARRAGSIEGAGVTAPSSRPGLPRQRQVMILDRLREHGAVRVAELVSLLGVSDMTVRRDLDQLQERGLLEKVHGGAAAIRSDSSLFEPGFVAKSQMMQLEKDAIAAAAATLVRPGGAIAISAGTTTYALARRLVDVRGLTVVTNSIPVADVFYAERHEDQTVIVTGGVRTPSEALVGSIAVEVLRTLHVDIVFMGVHGMEPRAGFTTPNILEAATNRAMIESGRRLVVLADHTKWGVVGISSMARLDEADTLITDAGVPGAARDALAAVVGHLVAVDAEPQALAGAALLQADATTAGASGAA